MQIQALVLLDFSPTALAGRVLTALEPVEVFGPSSFPPTQHGAQLRWQLSRTQLSQAHSLGDALDQQLTGEPQTAGNLGRWEIRPLHKWKRQPGPKVRLPMSGAGLLLAMEVDPAKAGTAAVRSWTVDASVSNYCVACKQSHVCMRLWTGFAAL